VVDGAGVAVAHQRRVGGGLHGHRATGAVRCAGARSEENHWGALTIGIGKVGKDASLAPARGRERYRGEGEPRTNVVRACVAVTRALE
jgi:hypothetical protein